MRSLYLPGASLLLLVFISLFLSISFAGDAVVKTVEAIHIEKDALKGKTVQVSGKVTKVNNGIMNRNFIHIQDGTGKKGTDDLTVTSKQTAKVGDKVIITGTIALDTDFGFGYNYPIILEKSKIEQK